MIENKYARRTAHCVIMGLAMVSLVVASILDALIELPGRIREDQSELMVQHRRFWR